MRVCAQDRMLCICNSYAVPLSIMLWATFNSSIPLGWPEIVSITLYEHVQLHVSQQHPSALLTDRKTSITQNNDHSICVVSPTLLYCALSAIRKMTVANLRWKSVDRCCLPCWAAACPFGAACIWEFPPSSSSPCALASLASLLLRCLHKDVTNLARYLFHLQANQHLVCILSTCLTQYLPHAASRSP